MSAQTESSLHRVSSVRWEFTEERFDEELQKKLRFIAKQRESACPETVEIKVTSQRLLATRLANVQLSLCSFTSSKKLLIALSKSQPNSKELLDDLFHLWRKEITPEELFHCYDQVKKGESNYLLWKSGKKNPLALDKFRIMNSCTHHENWVEDRFMFSGDPESISWNLKYTKENPLPHMEGIREIIREKGFKTINGNVINYCVPNTALWSLSNLDEADRFLEFSQEVLFEKYTDPTAKVFFSDLNEDNVMSIYVLGKAGNLIKVFTILFTFKGNSVRQANIARRSLLNEIRKFEYAFVRDVLIGTTFYLAGNHIQSFLEKVENIASRYPSSGDNTEACQEPKDLYLVRSYVSRIRGVEADPSYKGVEYGINAHLLGVGFIEEIEETCRMNFAAQLPDSEPTVV